MRTLTEVFAPGGSLLPESLRTLVVSPEREVEPGATVRATFAFYNLGGAAATGLGVRFRVPEGLRYQPGSAKVDDLPLEDQLGESPLLSTNGADVGEVPPGVERRISLAFVVAPTIENGAVLELQAALASYEIPVVGSNIVRLVAKSKPDLAGPATIAALEAVRAPEPGEEVRVLARVVNAGQSSAHDVVVVLPVPDRTTYVPDSARIDGREVLVDERGDPFGFGIAPVAVDSLAPGATLIVEYRVRIDAPLDDGTRLFLHCGVAASEVPEFDLARAELVVSAAPQFDNAETGLTVDVEGDVEPGRRVRIALVARNTGTCAASDIAMQIVLPQGFRYASGSRAVEGRSIGELDDPGMFRFGRLNAGDRVEVALEGYVVSPAANGSTLTVGGRVAWGTISRGFERTLVVRSQPKFTPGRNRLTIDGSNTVASGDDAAFDVTLLNGGTAVAAGAHLRVAADAGLENLVFSHNGGGTSRVHNGLVDLGVLEPSDLHILHFSARVAAPIPDRTELRLTATLETLEVPHTALGTVGITARSRPKFTPAGSKIVALSQDALRPDRTSDLAIHLYNEGTDVARDVRVHLQISPEARLQSVDGATRDGSVLIFGDVPAGGRCDAIARLRLERFVARGATVIVDARVAGVGVLPFALSPVTLATLAEPQFAQGASLRTTPLETVDAGDAMQYTLAIRNTGDGSAARVTIRTGLPPFTAYIPGSTSVNDVGLLDAAGSSVLWSSGGLVLEDVNPGVEVTVRYSVIVNTPLPAGTLIDAQAEIAWDGGGRTIVPAPAVRVRSTPAFAIRASGLPFSVAGVAPRTEAPSAVQRYAEPPPLPPSAPPKSLPQLPRAVPVQPGTRRPERTADRNLAPPDAVDAAFSNAAPQAAAAAPVAPPAAPVPAPPATAVWPMPVAPPASVTPAAAAPPIAVPPTIAAPPAPTAASPAPVAPTPPLTPTPPVAPAEAAAVPTVAFPEIDLPPTIANPPLAAPSVEAPSAAPQPVAPAAVPVAPPAVPTLSLDLTSERISQALKLLDKIDSDTLITHFFVVRALVPEGLVGGDDETARKFESVRDAVRTTFDRLFIKMRMSRYALTAKDIEDRVTRTALGELVDALDAPQIGGPVAPATQLARLTGGLRSDLFHTYRARLDAEPLGSAVPWIILASLLPERLATKDLVDESLGSYRRALIATFENLAALPLEEFHRVLSGRANAELDARLVTVKDVFRAVLDANASLTAPSGA